MAANDREVRLRILAEIRRLGGFITQPAEVPHAGFTAEREAKKFREWYLSHTNWYCGEVTKGETIYQVELPQMRWHRSTEPNVQKAFYTLRREVHEIKSYIDRIGFQSLVDENPVRLRVAVDEADAKIMRVLKVLAEFRGVVSISMPSPASPAAPSPSDASPASPDPPGQSPAPA